jgi:hypothetical protein
MLQLANHRRFEAFALLVWICAFPLESHANVGVPLFVKFIEYSWLLLIPIIGIEAFVLRKRLAVSLGRASAVSSLANITSTILGTAVVLGISFLLAITAGVSELSGAQGDITILFALIPCFFLSVWFEALVSSPFLKPVSREDVRKVFFLANIFSYAMLAIIPIARFIKNAIVQGQIVW